MVASRSIFRAGVTLLVGASLAAAATTTCSASKKCPEDAPCCSQYGECGVGAYCLGGCDPRMSFSLDSCAPEPQCASRSMTLDSLDTVVSQAKYLGDSTKYDWVYSDGSQVLPHDGAVLLTMPANSSGTVLASTVYMWYGKVSATMKTSRGPGVVTAFILLSDVKDEIDFEFIGVDLSVAQTNYYYQAIPVYTNSRNITDLDDTYDNYHTYEIDWTPDQVTWSVDGKVGRTLKRADTWNDTTQSWDYPQTPSRVQLSIWPGGAPSNSEYTIDWAGGAIDWESDDIKNYGYDFATVKSVDIQCYNGTSAPGTNNAVSYYYNNVAGTNNTVINGKNATVLASFLATGTDMDAGASSASASASSSTATAATIPGESNSGVGNSGSNDGSGSSGSGSSSSGSGSSSSGGSDCSGTSSSDFTQSCGDGSSSTKSGAVGVAQDRIAGASAFAAVVAFMALAWL